MITQTQGQIYLNDQRGCTGNTWYRSFHTFNFSSYFQEHTAAFGNLLAFNEDILAAGKSIAIDPSRDEDTIILPVAGGIEFRNTTGFQDYVTPGEILVIQNGEQGPCGIINPYGVESIHFIQLRIKKSSSGTKKTEQYSFDPEKRNVLSTLYSCGGVSVHIGKYTGRTEGSYRLQDRAHGVFAFVIQGAFEVSERLLQPKDGLTLWDLEEVEFEALSNEAILLLVEVPLDHVNKNSPGLPQENVC